LQHFPRFFPESWISAQKQDTRAILLKTALVHVSCIQNTQIRGETKKTKQTKLRKLKRQTKRNNGNIFGLLCFGKQK
jgi:hypothetical protein